VENTQDPPTPIIPYPMNPPDLPAPNYPYSEDWILVNPPPVRHIPQNITVKSPNPPSSPNLDGPYTFELKWQQEGNQVRCEITHDFPDDSKPVVRIKGSEVNLSTGMAFPTTDTIDVEITFGRTFIHGPDMLPDPDFNNGSNELSIGEYDGEWEIEFSNPDINYKEGMPFTYRRITRTALTVPADLTKLNDPDYWRTDPEEAVSRHAENVPPQDPPRLVKYYNSEIKNANSYLQVIKHIEPKEPIWIQCGANEMQHIDLGRFDCRTCALGLTGMWGEHYIVAQPLDDANLSLNLVDAALDKISTYRAQCGAQQNRMEHASKSVAISAVNLQDSESRIRDADMAKEMMNLTRANVLNQAGMAMLTQTARGPERVLALLQQ
jgi:hypothetical protein